MIVFTDVGLLSNEKIFKLFLNASMPLKVSFLIAYIGFKVWEEPVRRVVYKLINNFVRYWILRVIEYSRILFLEYCSPSAINSESSFTKEPKFQTNINLIFSDSKSTSAIKLQARLRNEKTLLPSLVSNNIRSTILVHPLAIIKALSSFEVSVPLVTQTFLAKAFPLPPGRTPTGMSLTLCQSGLVNIAFMASWGSPSPETKMMPLNPKSSFIDNVYYL